MQWDVVDKGGSLGHPQQVPPALTAGSPSTKEPQVAQILTNPQDTCSPNPGVFVLKTKNNCGRCIDHRVLEGIINNIFHKKYMMLIQPKTNPSFIQ